MAYRVSDIQTTNSFIQQMLDAKAALQKKQEEIASGYRVTNASDDPGRSGTIASLQHTLQRIDRHQERISLALNSLETQESTVSSANDLLIRAKELAAQAANGTLGEEERQQIADEIFQLRDQLAGLANTKFQGVYLYGGKDDVQQPFIYNSTFYALPPDAAPAANPPDKGHWNFNSTVAGITETRDVVISDSDSIRLNSSAEQVFAPAVNALEKLGRALDGYRTTTDGSGVPDGTGTAYTLPADASEQMNDIRSCLNSLDSARVDNIQAELSSIGARINRLDQTKQILETLKGNTDQARASVQDTDMMTAASEYSSLQISLQGLLASGAKINSLNLMSFL